MHFILNVVNILVISNGQMCELSPPPQQTKKVFGLDKCWLKSCLFMHWSNMCLWCVLIWLWWVWSSEFYFVVDSTEHDSVLHNLALHALILLLVRWWYVIIALSIGCCPDILRNSSVIPHSIHVLTINMWKCLGPINSMVKCWLQQIISTCCEEVCAITFQDKIEICCH